MSSLSLEDVEGVKSLSRPLSPTDSPSQSDTPYSMTPSTLPSLCIALCCITAVQHTYTIQQVNPKYIHNATYKHNATSQSNSTQHSFIPPTPLRPLSLLIVLLSRSFIQGFLACSTSAAADGVNLNANSTAYLGTTAAASDDSYSSHHLILSSFYSGRASCWASEVRVSAFSALLFSKCWRVFMCACTHTHRQSHL